MNNLQKIFDYIDKLNWVSFTIVVMLIIIIFGISEYFVKKRTSVVDRNWEKARKILGTKMKKA